MFTPKNQTPADLAGGDSLAAEASAHFRSPSGFNPTSPFGALMLHDLLLHLHTGHHRSRVSAVSSAHSRSLSGWLSNPVLTPGCPVLSPFA